MKNKEINNKIIKSVKINKEIKNEISYNNNNEMIIQYKINKKINKIRIFGDEFISKNINNCKIIYDNKYYELKELFDIKSIKDSKDIIEIKLIKINNIIDMSNMFKDCSSLLNIVDILKRNANNIIYEFYV